MLKLLEFPSDMCISFIFITVRRFSVVWIGDAAL
jgi:hypothetical protein